MEMELGWGWAVSRGTVGVAGWGVSWHRIPLSITKLRGHRLGAHERQEVGARLLREKDRGRDMKKDTQKAQV